MRFFIVFLILAVGGVVFWFSRDDEIALSTPIPKVFGTTMPKVVNDWFPREATGIKRPYELVMGAKSALLVNYDTGEVLYSKNQEERLPSASTIKIMTALIALESAGLSDTYVVSENASRVGENSMGLSAGEKLTLRELIYGLMLVSGNDAAVTIAEGIGGSEDAYVAMMNDKVRELGIHDTKFVNATGLDVDGEQQYTTAHDMLVIAHYVWENYADFGKITSTEHIYIEPNETHKAFDLYNDTNLLTTYPGVRGIKPGFTWEAGLCLVTYAQNEDRRFLGVILGSDDRRGEMKELLDYGFASYGIAVSHPALDL